MACGDDTCFPPFYEKFNHYSVFLSLEKQPSLLEIEEFENVIIGKHINSNCYRTSCKFHLVIIDRNLQSKFPPKISVEEFYYQSVDCLLTLVLHYFRNQVFSKGPISEILLNALNFHKRIPFQILKRPSVARKRLLRKRFKLLITRQSFQRTTPNLFNSHFLIKIETILNSPSGKDFSNLVTSLCERKTCFISNNLLVKVTLLKDARDSNLSEMFTETSEEESESPSE